MTTTSLWGAGFAYVTLGELLNPTGMVGGFLILGGCVLGNIYPPNQSNKHVDDNMTLPLTNSPEIYAGRARSSSTLD